MAVGGSSGGNARSIKAGNAEVTTSLNDSGLRSGLDKARKMVMKAGAAIAGGGGALIGLGGAVLGPIIESFREVVKEFDEIKKASDRLGTTPEIISALGYAAQQSGSNLEDLESAAGKMQKAISEAAHNGGDLAEKFKILGLDAGELLKLPLDEQLMAIADGLNELADPADRSALAMDIFGKSGRNLLPLMKNGAKGIRELMEEAKKVGKVVSGEDAANAERVGDAINRAWTAVKTTFLAVGAALLPQVDRIEQLSSAVVDGVKIARDFINENRELVLIVTAVAAGIVAAGAALVTIGTGLFIASIAASGFMAAIGAVGAIISTIWAWLPTIAIVAGIAAAIAALGYVLYEFTSVGEKVRDLFGEIGHVADWAWGILKTAWEGISTALGIGDMAGALDIARATLDVFWAALKVGAQGAWNFVKEQALDAWDDALGAAQDAVIDIKADLKELGTFLEMDFKDIFDKIWKAYKEGWKEAFNATIDMAKQAAQADLEMRRWVIKNAKNLAIGAATAAGVAGLGGIASTGKAGIEAAAEPVGEGLALARDKGAEQAQEIIKTEAERLKEKRRQLTEEKKASRRAEDKARLEEAIQGLLDAETALQGKVNAIKAKAAGMLAANMANVMFGIALAQDKQRAAAIGELTGSRGIFSTAGAAQQIFGGGSGAALDKIQKNTKDAADDLGVIKGKVGPPKWS
jgi:hypothetical protein